MPKDGPARHLLDAIQYIQDGGVYISPIFPRDLLSRRWTSDDPLRMLSKREWEAFHCLVAGMRPKEIASALDLNPRTLDTHRAHLMRKLEINDLPGLPNRRNGFCVTLVVDLIPPIIQGRLV